MRTTTASTTESGTWIYALWCYRSNKIYIGQTGGRLHPRSVGKRGSEHIRLGKDFLRLGGLDLRVPSQVYRWISQQGVENFCITPLEHTSPSIVDSREKTWMLKWGLGSLFNRDLPSVNSNKWLFMADRKLWRNELAATGGSFLSTAKSIVSRKKPLSVYDFSPQLLLTLISATEKFLSVAEHRMLFDRVSQFFRAHHKIFLPYRIPIKVPLASSSAKHQIRTAACSVMDNQPRWPVHLRTYLKSRICVITGKTPTVGDILFASDLTKLPSDVLTADDHDDCPCKQWAHLPGVTMHHGHIVFRDPSVLRHIAPSLDFSVFAQNMKNSTVPSHKTFSSSLKKALSATSSSLPEDRAVLHADIASEIVSSCASVYNTCAHECPKLVYAPYVQKQREKLPPYIIPHFMDKAPQVPIFACGHFWRHVHHSTYFTSSRYAELSRQTSARDANFLLLWQLVDSLSLATERPP